MIKKLKESIDPIALEKARIDLLRGINRIELAVDESFMLGYDYESAVRLLDTDFPDTELDINPTHYLIRANARYRHNITRLGKYSKQINRAYREMMNLLYDKNKD